MKANIYFPELTQAVILSS